MTQPQDPRRGFLEGTALRKLSGPRIALPGELRGGVTQGTLPRNGYGAFIRLHVHIQVGATGLTFKDAYTDAYTENGNDQGAEVDTDQHIYRLLDNVQLHNNKGMTPINASGFDLAIVADKKRYTADTIYNNAQKLEVGGKTVFHCVVDLPLAPNLGRGSLWGLIGLQSNTAEWTIKLQSLDIRQVLNGITDAVEVKGYVDSTLYYFDVPNPQLFHQPPLAYAYMIQGQTVAGGTVNTGDYWHELSPLGGTLMRLLMRFKDTQGRPFDSYRGDYLPVPAGMPHVKNLKTVIDNVDYLWDISALEHESWHKDIYGKDSLPGLFTFLDGLTVLDTQVGEFMAPDFLHGFLSPDNYASVKAVAAIDLNGGQAGEVRVVKEYLQGLR